MDIEVWTPSELTQHIDDGDLLLLDVRRGERFANGHIPGARNFSVYGINTYDTDPAPLASFVKMWSFQLALSGVTREHRVVVYAQFSDESAARAAWFLDWLGHPRAALLDGGLDAWVAAGGAVSVVAAAPKSVSYPNTTVASRVATWQDVMGAIGSRDTVILDTRSDEEWYGRDARGAKRAGAIPGAVHLEWRAHLDDSGRMLPKDELRKRFEALGITPEREVIAYCNTGYRSAHAYIALGMLGYRALRNYVGSWQEWGNRDDCPVVIPDPGSVLAPSAGA